MVLLQYTRSLAYVFSAGFFSLSAIRRGLSLVVLKRPRPSSCLILFLTICKQTPSRQCHAGPSRCVGTKCYDATWRGTG